MVRRRLRGTGPVPRRDRCPAQTLAAALMRLVEAGPADGSRITV